MNIRHLNCGTLNPIFPRIPAVCYCLLLETADGFVLIDTGLGTRDYTDPSLPIRIFTAANRMPRKIEETALSQVEALGHSAEDVRDIVLTHLHLDHSGGLPDFPWARIHLHADELAAAMDPTGILRWMEYVPDHWKHGPQWVAHSQVDGTCLGLESIFLLGGKEWEVRLVPLPGHSPGHSGVAVRLGDRWLLHIGDAASPFYEPLWVERYGHPPRWLSNLAGSPAQEDRLLHTWQEHRQEADFIFAHDAITFERHREAKARASAA